MSDVFSGVGLGFGWEFLVKAAVEGGSGDSGFARRGRDWKGLWSVKGQSDNCICIL